MKYQILLLAFVAAAFGSCTTAYKTGQTPDDVYFSPARPGDEYVQVKKQDDRRYESLEEYYDDRFLRMRVANRYRWSALDDYYFNNPYYYNYYSNYSSWNNPWNSYWLWNNYYNPYCGGGYGYGGGIIIKNPTAYTPPPSKPVAFNPRSYLGNTQTSVKGGSNAYYNNNSYSGGTRYNNSNSSYNNNSYYNNGGSGSKSYSSGSNSSYTPSSSTPSRSYTPSSSSGSSSSSSSGSSSSGSSGSTRPPR